MTAAAVDTLKRALRDKAKFSAEQAEGIAEAMQGDVATKTDLRESELRLKAEIEASKAEIIKWMFGTIGFQTLIILGAVITLARIVAK